MSRLKLLLLVLGLFLITSCAVQTGPPVSPEEIRRSQAEIWKIKLQEYFTCEERVGRLLIRILPQTEQEKPYPWFLVNGVNLARTPEEVDQALSEIFNENLPEKGILVTFVHPYYQNQGLQRGMIIRKLPSQGISLEHPIKLELTTGQRLNLKPLVIQTRPVDFRIVDSPQPNAWVTPDYRMYVTTALCRVLTNDNELAAVIGHELAHLKRGHLKKQMALMTLRDLLGIGIYALAGQTARDVYQLGTNFALLKFSRDQEREADFYGLWYIYRAGFNLEQAAQVWIHLAAVLPPGPPSILSTHPSSAERLARIRKIVKAIQAGQSFEAIKDKIQ